MNSDNVNDINSLFKLELKGLSLPFLPCTTTPIMSIYCLVGVLNLIRLLLVKNASTRIVSIELVGQVFQTSSRPSKLSTFDPGRLLSE